VDDTYRQVPVRRIHLNWTRAPDPNRFLYCNPMVEKQVGQWLAQWEPDIVHVTSCLTLSASVIQAAKACQLPVVLTLTDFWFVCPRVILLRGDGSLCDGRTTSWECLKCMLWDEKAYQSLRSILSDEHVAFILTWISKHPQISRMRGLRGMALDMQHRKSYLATMLDAADRVTAPSAFLRGTLKGCGISTPIRVVHSGHDLAWLVNSPKKRPASLVRIGYVGQVIPIKGVHILLSAFQSADLVNRAQLLIFGDHDRSPEYTEHLAILANGSNSTAEFRGAFPYEHLGEVLSEIDVLAVPSQWHENNPRVIQEAFASKTPVIASDVGGIVEFVQHEVNGLLFERGDVDELSRKLQRIVQEPGLLERLQAGVPRVKTIEEEVTELEAIYSELAS
jgi:glycosyltransferase involved in cell wall biosynthesis